MNYVIDSSVMLKWVLTETDSDKALRLRDDFRKAVHEMLSPDIFPVGQARTLLLDILTTPPHVFPFQPFLLRAIDISSAMRIGVYDCIYVALAEQEKCELVTADTTMVRALQGSFPFIRTLASFP